MLLSNKIIILKITITVLIFCSLASCALKAQNVSAQSDNTAQQDSSIKQQKVVDVSIIKFKFVPEVLTIKAGQRVRWTNNEKRQYHSVWFEESGQKESDYMFPKETFEMQFDTPGVFSYRCGPHPEMIAKIIVN